MSASDEIARRRTFAIISHPDAGKTTLTEKFLLYGNAVHLAGAVKDRKNQRATRSDWMELERQRGISISSTVLQFEYAGFAVNLLDTPGHKDFSEDTYRVLTAVDAAVMVIDAAKGIEAQTRKLFEVCRLRGVPIFTFMNQCDRPTRNPVVLLDELESVLGLQACAVTWPLGEREATVRRTRAARLLARAGGGLTAVHVPAGAEAGYLRLPFVASPEKRVAAETDGARALGVMPGYPRALCDLGGFGEMVLNRQEEFPGGRMLAERLVTLPTHGRMVEECLARLCDRTARW